MKEEEIVKKVCEIMGVKYSHYDNHDMLVDYFGQNITSKPKIVAYSSRMGMWQFAILEDMSVVTPTSEMTKRIIEMRKMVNKLTGKNTKSIKYKKSEKY